MRLFPTRLFPTRPLPSLALGLTAALTSLVSSSPARAEDAAVQADAACKAHGWAGADSYWFDAQNRLHVLCNKTALPAGSDRVELTSTKPLRTATGPVGGTGAMSMAGLGLLLLLGVGGSTSTTSGTN